MPLVVAFDDEKLNRDTRSKGTGRPAGTITTFFRSSKDAPHDPTALHVQYAPESTSRVHFHTADQFQIIVDGKCTFGRHDIAPYHVHFARAYTPYGPIVADKDAGVVFMTLRARHDPGAQFLPAAQDKLKQVPDRRPWQITRGIVFSDQVSGVELRDVPDIRDDQGLYTGSLTLAPGMQAVAPDASGGDGQYVVIVKGSLVYDGREYQAITVVSVKPEEDAFRLRAGPQGLQAIIVNFPKVPKVMPRIPVSSTRPADAEDREWRCALCAFAYSEARGMPEDGIPPGTRWEDVAETWTCPDCSAAKADFERGEP